MGNKVAFIGHRVIFDKFLEEKLYLSVLAEITKGCRFFTMGVHGQFDETALRVCRKLKKRFVDLKIEVVLTSLKSFVKDKRIYFAPEEGIDTVFFDIEEVHYKRKITESNKAMISACDTLICYVDESAHNSGAKTALQFARTKGLKIINIFLL